MRPGAIFASCRRFLQVPVCRSEPKAKPTVLKHRFYLTVCLFFFVALAWGQAPSANFNSDITGGCSPIVVNFKDLSTGNPTSWFWDFGNGSTSTRQNPSTTYFGAGTYTVTLTATNAAGSNTTVKTAYITVYNEPVADFTVNKKTGCSPTRIQFTDLSTTPVGTNITGWSWDFGDGGTSNQKNPQYIYRNAGSYTVTLKITNDKGCTKLITKPNLIDITPGVAPSFSYVDPGVCSAPATINYTNTSTGPGTLSYKWTLGNSPTVFTTKNAGTTYVKNGTYTVTLIVSSTAGCTDSTAVNVTVGRVNTDFIVPATICPKTPVQFTNNSTPRPISAQWQFSNGTTDNLFNGQTTFATPGTYTVTLINTYTVCTDTLRKNITVAAGPTIDFKAKDTGSCKAPFTVNFQNTSNGTTYLWRFGDGTTSTQTNPSHTYTAIGDYDVTLIATGANGCVDSITKKAFISIKKPVISFPGLPAKGCIPFTNSFSADINMADTVSSYKWDFGDGVGNSTLKNPTYTYNKVGTYDVTLTITSSTGCTETLTLAKAVKVGTMPVADFNADPTNVCASTGVQFNNTSPEPTDEWEWFFGDGSKSNLRDPLHIYNDTGMLDVKLVVYNNGCPSDTMIKKKYVNIKPPVSKFDYKPDCNNRTVYTFTDKSIGALTWQWDFGDGTTYTGQTPPVHTFPAYGTYNVKLTTTNGSCTYSTTRTITIADYIPDFSASIREGCKPFTTTFNATSPNPQLMQGYLWDFGNGTIVDGGMNTSIQNTFTQAGNFYVKLITVDSFGCGHVLQKNDYIRVNGPTANFGSVTNAGCKGLNATFIDSTKTDGVNNIVSWQWNFGDGTSKTYTAGPFQHQYDSIGNYDITLSVVDQKGCTDTKTIREFVKISNIKARWSTGGATCPGAPVGFSNESLSDLPFNSIWDFGDSQTSTDLSPSHIYADTGFYTVKLKIKDLVGCEDSLTKTNAVQVSLPKASFTANNFASYCTPFEAKFINTSTFASGFSWDLSIATSNQPNPSLYYTQTGVYPIKLVVTSPGGCKDSATNTLRVFDPKDGTITYAPLKGCIPMEVDFDAFTAMNGQFIWDFGDGYVTDTSVNKIKHTYRDFGDFVPKIILIEPSKTCIVSLTGTEVINMKGVKAKFVYDRNFYCDSGRVQILDSTINNDPIVKYNWDFGDGTVYNTQNPVHNYTTPGNYTIRYTVTTQSGCVDSLNKGIIRIIQSPLIAVQTDTVICVNDLILHRGVFQRPDTSTVRWSWDFPNGNNSSLQFPPIQQYKVAGSFPMTTIATNSSGCADTVVKNLLVHPLPTITLPASLSKVVGVPLLLPATYSTNNLIYNWSPSTNLDCTNCPQPTTDTKFNRQYFVTVTDSNGCKNRADVQVIVTCKGATIFLPNTFSPNGDGSNDVFYARGTGLDRVKSLRIFNRWGEVVFEQTNFPINNSMYGWDGKYKGLKALPDVYVYQVEIFCENSEIIRFNGNIALIQ